MSTTHPTRRELMAQAALLGALGGVAEFAGAGPAAAASRAPLATEVVWLDRQPPAAHAGQTWGVPWPQGLHRRGQTFRATRADGAPVALQTWPLAYWPDGSLKWTAHAIAADAAPAERLSLTVGKAAAPAQPVRVKEDASGIEVTTGDASWRFPRSGAALIASARRGGREVLRDVRLVCLTQSAPDPDEAGAASRTRFESELTSVVVEQNGPVRAVVRAEGRHRGGDRAWAPFTVRFYAYAGADSLRIVHSFVFDGDPQKDFICGLGVTARVPMADELYDRHVRFTGEGAGLWAEAVRTLTGLRRDPGRAFREAQVAGRKTPPASEMAPAVRESLSLIPAWGDFTLSQPNPDGFQIEKRTGPGHGWIGSDGGRRASGLAYVGGASGGAALALADFWKAAPTRLDIRGATGEAAELTAWLWSPDAAPMDMRFYHGGLGMETHAQENRGLDITYEDYEKGWGTAHGIARTSELTLWALDATPERARFAQMAAGLDKPPRLVCTPERLHAAGVLGAWTPADRSTPARKAIEDRSDQLLDFYIGQVEQRRWYGFWNYGDVMHTYDVDRHQWRYDVGGFAWDNSELATDLWLWTSFLRSGRADVFRLAEAMSRHTSEVDVYHVGPFRGFGTRHGVQHWADSSKQPRVSNAAFHRAYYYLTADERIGDLLHALVGCDETLTRVNIGRKLPDAAWPKNQVRASFGTDWSSFAAAWLTEWERTGDVRWRDRIVAGMRSIAALKHQWFCGDAPYDIATGRFYGGGDWVHVSHLNAVFGGPETHVELLELIHEPAYEAAWIDYCRWYNAPPRETAAHVGAPVRDTGLRQAHSRLTAYAAWKTRDPQLAARVWREFSGRGVIEDLNLSTAMRHVTGPTVLNPIDEAPGVSTNGAAQWGLAAAMNLALAGAALDGGAGG